MLTIHGKNHAFARDSEQTCCTLWAGHVCRRQSSESKYSRADDALSSSGLACGRNSQVRSWGSRLPGDRRPFCHENTGYGLFAQNFLQIRKNMPPQVDAAPCEGELAGFSPS